MLALILTPNVYVLIGNKIKVMNIGGSKVRLGFKVPPDVQVDRAVVRQARLAAEAAATALKRWGHGEAVQP